MFTGLVEATGSILSIEQLGKQARYQVHIPFATELALGDSVAHNGCCLTVAALGEDSAYFDLLSQTLSITSLGDLELGSIVNLERALRAGDRLGGHFVQGHVDATGILRDLSQHGQDHRLEVILPQEIHKYCIAKGSIAIDGISLTIAELTEDSAVFWITPHTYSHTHLHSKEIDQRVNLEVDLLAKYTEKLLQGHTSPLVSP